VKKIFAAAAIAATAFLALPVTAANATTYLLNVDNCSGGCGQASYGQINVTGQGTGVLSVDIELNANTVFQQAGKSPHDDIWFDTNTNSVTIGGLVSPFSANGVQAAGSNAANGASFGNYDYVIQRSSAGNPGSPAGGQHSLTFTVSGPSALALESTTVGANNIFFVVDVASYNPLSGVLVNTGRVGATIQGGVPEPASWSLMILGFGGLGAMLRTNRRRMALAAAA
jgi:hypothetical protein